MEQLKQLIEKSTEEFNQFKAEIDKFIEKGNKSASTRARNHALEVSKQMKEIRKQILIERK